MSDVPKRELAVVGAACAVCCGPLIAGAVIAAPVAVAGGAAVAAVAGIAAVAPRRLNRSHGEPLP